MQISSGMENAEKVYMQDICVESWKDILSPEAYEECVGVLLYRVWVK
jgi:hypothetical protein